MAVIVTSNALGLSTSSLALIGAQGGKAAAGRDGEGVYVNAATGNLVVQRQDDMLVGLGPDLPLLRTYNSQCVVDGDNDDNWRMGFYRRLVDLDGDVNCPGSSITRIDAEGAELVYRYDAGRGCYLNTDGAGAYDTLAYDAATRLWTWTDGDSGATETYQWNGGLGYRQLLREQDADGNRVNYAYAANGLLRTVSSANSQGAMQNRVDLNYDGSAGNFGNLLSVQTTAWDAQTGASRGAMRVRYGYDSCDRLSTVTVDLTPEDNSIADGRVYVTRYAYDGDSRRLARISQTDGTALGIGWACVDGDWRVASLVNAQGEMTRFDYDCAQRATTVTDAMGFKTRYAYDAQGRMTQITAPAVDGVAQVRRFEYNAAGDLVRSVDGRGLATERLYDRNGMLVQERDAAGNAVVRSYNAQNQLLTLTRFLAADPDGSGPAAPAQPQTTHYVYDAAQGRRLRFVISEEGRVTEYRYNGLGQRVSDIQYARELIDTAGWRVNPPSRRSAPAGEADCGSPVSWWQGGYASVAPDVALLQAWAAARDPRFTLRTDHAWDYRGQLASQIRYTRTDASGQGVADGSEAITRYIYSPSGQLLQTLSPNGGRTDMVYDGLGREVLRSNALGEIASTEYDDAGRRTVLRAANGLQTVSQYDSAGRLVAVLQRDPGGAELERTEYLYDDDGRLRATRDATGVTRWMLYDAAGRKTADIDGNGSLTEYLYDGNDQVVQTIQYATPVRALLSPVMQVEVFNYADPGIRGDDCPPPPSLRYASLEALGLGAESAGSVLTPVASFQASDFGVDDARHFAATADLNTYALRYSGSFTAFAEGDYSFYTRSDAGSRLYIDGQLVIDNDGLHEARTMFATVHLAAGVHRIVQTYFDSGGAQVNAFGQGVASTVLAQRLESGGAPLRYSVALPPLPAGATPLATELQVIDAEALKPSWQSDIRLALSGAINCSSIEVSEVDAPGRVAPNPLAVSVAHAPPSGGTLVLTVSETSNQPGVDARIGRIQLVQTWAMDALKQVRPAASDADRMAWNVYDAANRLVRTVDARGSVTAIEYDGASQVTRRIAYANGVDVAALGRAPTLAMTTPAASAEDRVSRLFYDDDGLLRATLDGEGYLAETVYDAAGQLQRTIRHARAVAPALRAAAGLDALRPEADPDDREEWTLRNARGQIVAHVDAEGYLDETRYDADGNVIARLRYARRVDAARLGAALAAPDAGAALSALRPLADNEDRQSQFAYDLLDRVTRETDAEGTVSAYGYNLGGQMVSSTRAVDTDEARTRLWRYDLLGRLRADMGGTGAQALAALGAQADAAAIDAVWAAYATRYEVDAAGRRSAAIDANGLRTLYRYDEDGQLRYTINALGEVQEQRYDTLGNLVGALRHARRIDALALPALAGGLQRFSDAVLLAADPGDRVEAYRYYRDGLLAERVDALGNVTQYRYDAFDAQTREVLPQGDALVTLHLTRYDRRGMALEQRWIDARGVELASSVGLDAFGQQVSSVDANGQLRRASYDHLGRLLRSVDATGAVRARAWDAHGRVLAQIDALGNVVTTRYDRVARSSTVISAEGNAVSTLRNRHGETAQVIDGLGHSTALRYDADGRLLQTRTPLTATGSSYDRGGRLAASVDANGVRTVYRYDAANRLLQTLRDPDGLALSLRQDWDALGNLVASVDARGVLTAYRYDLKGQLLEQVLDPDGLRLATGHGWDAQGRETLRRDANGIATVSRYDGFGRLVATVRDPGGMALLTRYELDGNGNRLAIVDAAGGRVEQRFDAENRLLLQVDAALGVSALRRDAEGRQIATIAYAHALSQSARGLDAGVILAAVSADAAQDRVQYQVYDRDGRLVAGVTGLGALTRYRYDANGNVIERRSYAQALDMRGLAPGPSLAQLPDALPAVAPDDARDRRLQTVYDAENRVLYTLDGAGALVEQQWDGNGNLLRSRHYASVLALGAGVALTAEALRAAAAGIADAARDQDVRNLYDAANRLTWQADGSGSVRSFGYDAAGNRLRSIRYATALAAGEDPSAIAAIATTARDRIEASVYDAANRLVWQIDNLGGVLRQRYDGNGNLVERRSYAQVLEAAAQPHAIAAYDVAWLQGRLRENAADRVLRYRYDAANWQVLVIDGAGAATQTDYDALGRVVRIVRYARTAAGADAPAASADDRITRQDFDAAGRLLRQIDALGYVSSRRYDALGQLIEQRRHARALAAPDAAGLPESDGDDRITSMRYDADGRLIASVDALGYQQGFGYDALGNRVSMRNALGNVWRYDYDAASRLTQETSPQVALAALRQAANGALAIDATVSASVVTRLSYDALGNLVERIEAAGRAEQRSTQYGYDAAGRQVRTSFPAQDIYDDSADNPLANGRSGDATRTERRVLPETVTRYDALGDAVASRDVNGNWRYKAYDGLGRVRYDTDALGYVTAYEYNRYGDVTHLTRHAQALPAGVDAGAVERVDALLRKDTADRNLYKLWDGAGRMIEQREDAVDNHDASAAAGLQDFRAGRTVYMRYNAFGETVQQAELKNALTDDWLRSTHWYDRLGREIALLDAGGYLTESAWDFAGNLVLRTERAQAVAGAGLADPADLQAAPPTAQASAEDRSVRTAWDRNNRKISETRLGIEIGDGAFGADALRADLVTRYAYDALGNLVATTDAAGAVSYNWYDALGRVVASAQPTRSSTIDKRAITPLTLYARDAHGMVLAETALAAGAASVALGAFAPGARGADDRVTLHRYDSHGNLVQNTDAMGNSVYYSVDASGRVRKQWQTVTAADGSRATLWKVQYYDAAGQLTLQRASFTADEALLRQSAWNAFGEKVAEAVAGGGLALDDAAQQRYDYDRAGRLWRTNSGGGQVRIALHDLQGNATVELQSAGSANLWDEVDAASALRSGAPLRRTDSVFDRLGHLVMQLQPERLAMDDGVRVDADGLLATPLAGQVDEGGVWRDLPRRSDAAGAMALDLSGLAAGVHALRLLDAAGQVARQLSLRIDAARAAQVVAASGMPPLATLQLAERSVGGLPDLFHDVGERIAWGNPGVGVSQQFRYRAAGGDWQQADIQVLGDGYYGIDTSLIAAGHYDYELLLTSSAGKTQRFAGAADLGTVRRVGVAPLLRDANGQLLGGSNARVLQWKSAAPAGRYTLRYRAAGGAWQSANVEQDIVGVDVQGQLVGARYVRVDGWAAGDYEYELSLWHGDTLVAQSNGTLQLRADGSGEVGDTTPPWQDESVIAGAPARYLVSAALRPIVEQGVDRWGNVLWMSDARNAAWRTGNRYDAANRIVAQSQPQGDGSPGAARRLQYDRMGRLIAQIDGNGNISRFVYDSAGQLAQELHADGGVVQYAYNAFGERVRQIDATGQTTLYRYDRMGRLLQTQYPTVAVYGATSATRLRFVGYKALTESLRWDEAGRLIARTDGNGDTSVTGYDLQGNVTLQCLPLGQATQYWHDANGRVVRTRDANGAVATWTFDAAGLLLAHRDFGGADTSYVYDGARQLLRQRNGHGQWLEYAYDSAGQLLRIDDLVLGQRTDYAYDAAGHRVLERMAQGGALYQDSVLGYDARGRLIAVDERSNGVVRVDIAYDNADNRIRIQTRVHAGGADQEEDRWFGFDAMNRQVLVNAASADGTLGGAGRRIAYDLAGRRLSETWNGSVVDFDGNAVAGEVTQMYRYDALGRLASTERDGIEIDRRYYDGAGRVIQQGLAGLGEDLVKALNVGVPESDQISGNVQVSRYDANGWQQFQRVTGGDGAAKYEVSYVNGYDALGNVLVYSVANHGDNDYTNTFRNKYEAREGYLIVRTDASSTMFEDGYNTRSYDVNGNLTGIQDATKSSNDRRYVSNAQGQILWAVQDGRVQRQLLANGELLGRYGVAPDRYDSRDDEGNLRYAALADMDFSYAAVNGQNPWSAARSWSTQPGDTLQSIAQKMYGDSRYWYLVADANGLKENEPLGAGRALTLPAATITRYNAEHSFKPYSSDALIGDTSPNLPPPDNDSGCGGLLMIVVIIVAVVVTVYTAGAAASAMGAVGTSSAATASTMTLGSAALSGGTLVTASGAALSTSAVVTAAAIGGAAGSIASQLVGMALGVQQGFSWKGVALGALSAGVTAGVGSSGLIAGTDAWATAGKAVLSNVATQGIAVMTGLQDKFSWIGVAAAGAGAFVGATVGEQIKGLHVEALGDFGSAVLRGTISGVAAGATVSLLRGGRFSIVQVATDAFGNALAGSLVETMARPPVEEPAAAARPEAQTAQDVAQQTEALPGETDVSADGGGESAPGLGARQVRAGDYRGSLERIARAQLGPNATQREINEYVGQLFEINGIGNARTIQPDRMITLPDANTPAASEGLGLYGKDIACGELQKAAQAAAQRQSDAAMQVPIDPRDGMRVGPTVERAQAMGYAQAESASTASSNASAPSAQSGLSTYDKVSLGIHGVLSVAGAIPFLGAIPDAVDLAYTAVEYPFGKSTGRDLALSATAVAASVVPGADQAADVAKIASRAEKASEAVRTVSKIEDVSSPGSRLLNLKTDVSKLEFESNLISNGFAKSTSKDGAVNIFVKGDVKYTTREFSNSTKGPTAEVFRNGTPSAKIRLGN